MTGKISAIVIGILCIVIAGLIYLGVAKNRKITSQDNLIKASTDTLHKFKTTLGNQGGYISILIGDKSSLLDILQSKLKEDSINKSIIDSLKKDKNLQSATMVSTSTTSNYSHKIDTSKNNRLDNKVTFRDSISTKFYDASINVKNDSSKWHIHTKDILNLVNTNKPNRGLFSGKTLTTYVTSQNPDTDITGVTSISTVVDKRKVRISPTLGIGLNSDIHGKNIRTGYQIGIGVSF